jgi:hypothetical protein
VRVDLTLLAFMPPSRLYHDGAAIRPDALRADRTLQSHH